ncbi:MAG: T9SS type A sorting domain-containing protein [Bacteroidetes bacterium]|nr:T9SS type A sorting domain-containing protein [Bacteroidota bacterium]
MKSSGLETRLKKEKKGKPEKKNKEEENDSPEMASFTDFYLTMDPATGNVPSERRWTAYKATKALLSMRKADTDPVIQWTNIPSNSGGRIRALKWDPWDPAHKKVWAGSVTGGLWYNNDITNSASSWVGINDFWSNLSVSSIAFDPNNNQVMYVGTGEAQTSVITYRESSGKGVGIFKSADAGQTWTLMPSTEGFAYVNDILVRNENGTSVIYAGVVSGIYMGASHLSQPSDGLYRSSDGGTSWTQVLPNITNETVPYAVSDIEMNSNGRIFIGTFRNIDGKGGATLLYSDLGTAGSWTINETYRTQIEADPNYYLPGMVMIACAPSDPNIVYAVIAAGFNNGWPVYYGMYIIKSTNQGSSWSSMNIPPDYNGMTWATIAWHALDIAVDPVTPTTLWVGGLDLNQSTDGGMTWNKRTDWALMYQGGGTEYVHGDQHSIVYRPGSSSEIIFSTDGGVFYTNNATNPFITFSERSKNLSTLQFYTCAIQPLPASNHLMGGLQDNGTLWYTGNPLVISDLVGGGDGAYCFFDNEDPNLMISSIYYNVYSVYNGGSMLNYISDYSSGYFINPADYDSKHNTLYANAGDLFGNLADQVLRIKDVDDAPIGEFLTLGSTVPFTHIKVSPNSDLSNVVVFAGTLSGRLFKMTNSQNTPVVTEIGSPDFPMGAISSVAVGHSDDTLMVTFSNYGVASVWLTDNGGQNWTNIEGNLPDIPVRWAIFHPQGSTQALIATEIGVWSSTNLNQSAVFWTPVNEGLANVRVDMLQIRNSDKKVCAASHGRGLFTGIYHFATGSSAPGTLTTTNPLHIYPNPVTGSLFIESPSPGEMEIKLFSPAGQLIINETRKHQQTNIEKLNLNGLKPGVYLIDIQCKTGQLTRKIIIQ